MKHRFSSLFAGLLLPLTASAHHTVNAFFDTSSPMEIEGTLTLMKWQNPHVLLEIEREAGNGETEH